MSDEVTIQADPAAVVMQALGKKSEKKRNMAASCNFRLLGLGFQTSMINPASLQAPEEMRLHIFAGD